MSCYCHEAINGGLTPWNAKIDGFLELEENEEEKKKIVNYCGIHV